MIKAVLGARNVMRNTMEGSTIIGNEVVRYLTITHSQHHLNYQPALSKSRSRL